MFMINPAQATSLLKRPLVKEEKIAFVGSTCLGDALIAMVTVNNLVSNGYRVDVFSDYLKDLQAWFPWVKILPQVNFNCTDMNPDQQTQEIFASYPTVMHMYNSKLAEQLKTQHPNSIILSQSPLYKARMSMVDIQAALCQSEFNLKNIVRKNNIQIPAAAELVARKHCNRIVVHPTSSLARKNWPKNKFIKLSQKLAQLNYESCFIVAPHERASWQDVVNYGIALPEFASLNETAAFIYESAFFIGNDSGIGHLASNLGVPTVSIILRNGVATQWRPTWAPGVVVLSPSWLNPRPIKEKLWQHFISVAMVLRKFEQLSSLVV